MARERHDTAFVVGAALGGVAGAVWGLLNATTTGAEARRDLRRRLDTAADRLVVAAAAAEVAARTRLARRDVGTTGTAGMASRQS